MVLEALTAIEEKREDSTKAVAMAKANLNDTYQLVINEATPMNCGIGVTDELDVGLFLKRARVAINTLGDSAFLRDRFATLNGY